MSHASQLRNTKAPTPVSGRPRQFGKKPARPPALDMSVYLDNLHKANCQPSTFNLKKARRLQTAQFRTRARIHFGEASSFDNKVKDTFSTGEGEKARLYFRLESGQVVRADRAVRPPSKKKRVAKNLVLRRIASAAIAKTAKLAA